MKNRPKLQAALKALLLMGLGFFLYSRIANGTLFFYINQRFAGLTLFAVIGLMIIGISYQYGTGDDAKKDESGHENGSGESNHDGQHSAPHGHAHHHHGHHHNHALTWGAALILSIPILLGLFVTPQPLGASAMNNREVGFDGTRSGMPAAVGAATEKASTDRNILDWIYAFQAYDQATFEGDSVDVIGFVFRNKEHFAEDEFALTRYIVSCCVADASYVSLVTRGPQTEEFANDTWVRIQGHFEMGIFKGNDRIILIPDTIEPVPVPNQPYLYP
ncbi:MAG: TIGR03943 family protein [Chloroflexota bacterium]